MTITLKFRFNWLFYGLIVAGIAAILRRESRRTGLIILGVIVSLVAALIIFNNSMQAQPKNGPNVGVINQATVTKQQKIQTTQTIPTTQQLPAQTLVAQFPPLSTPKSTVILEIPTTPIPYQGFAPSFFKTQYAETEVAKNPISIRCIDWRDVTSNDVGKKMCVYGSALSYQVYRESN